MCLHKTILDGLNTEQGSAVTAPDGPVLIVAGPGTGKTLTIVRRIAYLVGQGVNPENIAAVTFTNRAARQMQERTYVLLGEDASGAFIGTLHLLGLRILRDCLPAGFIVYGRNEQMSLLKRLIKGSRWKAEDLAERISRIKGLLENAGDEINDIYSAYEHALHESNALDFDDLIMKPVSLFGDTELLEKYRQRCRHIIVDEYQDINPAQYRLLKLLSGDSGNIFAVGDSDQAIYAFRGADIENFLNFDGDFRNTSRVELVNSYRSSGTIIGAAGSLISNNKKRMEKRVVPVKESDGLITVYTVPDERTEGEVIVDEIEARIGGTSHYRLMNINPGRVFSDNSYGFSDFAVLFRTNAQAKALEEAFGESGIPFQVIGRRHTEKRKKALDALSRLRHGTGQDITDDLLKEIAEELRAIGISIDCTLDSPSIAVNVLNELSLLTPEDDFDLRADAVALMTLHMAKGLEFRVVFIAGTEDGLIPYTITKGAVDMEEERRLFYVGMTRAKDELFLIHARKRFLYGRQLSPSPSQFLNEIPDRFLDRKSVFERQRNRKDSKQMKLF